MYEYPSVECYFINGNIQIENLLENDELHIISNNKEYILKLTNDIINSIKTDVYYFSDYKLKFLENIFNIEYIFPNINNLDLCYIKRKSEFNKLNFNYFQKECYSYKLILTDFELKARDKLKYKVNFIDYELFLTPTIIDQIKSDNGFLFNLEHLITYHVDSVLGIKYILIQTGNKYTDVDNSHYLSYYDSLTNKEYLEYDIIKYSDDYLILKNLNIKSGTISIKFNNNEKYNIILDNIISQLDNYYEYIIKKEKIYKLQIINNNLNTHTFDIKISNLSNLTFDVSECYIESDSFFNIYKHDNINIRKITITSNPGYDTVDQLNVYTKSELDHIKHRCICNLSEIISQLNDIRFGNSEDSSEIKQYKADQIFNYKVMPSSYSKNVKQRIYTIFGPFTDFSFDDI